MIPLPILLPKLSAKEHAEFQALIDAYEAATAVVAIFNNDGRAKRREEINELLKRAKPAEILTLTHELTNLDETYRTAKRAAKRQLRALNPRYVELFERMLDKSDAHVDKLVEKATASYAEHFAAFGAQPVGQSPVVEALLHWKRDLRGKREGLQFYAADAISPQPPRSILPFPTMAKTKAEELV